MSYFNDAFLVLKDIMINKKYLSPALSSVKTNNRNMVTQLVYGVLENNIKLNYIISQFVKKIDDIQLQIILNIGTYSLTELTNVPNYAIVNECVNVCKKNKLFKYTGLVNVCLKKVAQNNYALPENNENPHNLSILYSKPIWFIRKLIKRFGIEQTKKIIINGKSNNTIRINQNLMMAQEFKNLLLKNNVKHEDTILNNVLIVDEKDIKNIDNSLYTHQSLGSVLIVDCFSNDNPSTILDCCASPGGKAIYMEEKFNCTVVACDIHQHRVELIKKYANRLKAKNIVATLQDSTITNSNFINKFDIILCDVPCSGSGTFISKPDIFLDIQEDFSELNNIQLHILNNCCKYLKNNGELIYSTCSILEEENDNIIKKFLNENKEFYVEKVSLPIKSYTTQFGTTMLPNISGTEGFFVTKLRRK